MFLPSSLFLSVANHSSSCTISFPMALMAAFIFPLSSFHFFCWLFPIVSSLRLSFCGLFILISSTISTCLGKWFADIQISAVKERVVAACASKGV
jgi:hypothetical protein